MNTAEQGVTLYSYGTIAVADAVGDESTAAHFTPRVIRKHFMTGRSRSYYLVLEPWSPITHSNSLGVSKTLFDKAQAEDSICLELRQGRLNAPWYTQEPCYGMERNLQR